MARRNMITDFAIDDLRKVRAISFLFRYPLHLRDFHEMRRGSELRRHYAAKALFNDCSASGEVDRTTGYSGEIVALYVPITARRADEARICTTRIPPDLVLRNDGRRNWPEILKAAEACLQRMIV